MGSLTSCISSADTNENQQFYLDNQKHQLIVATLNYGGIMHSPFQFVTNTYEAEINQMSVIFLNLLPKYVKNFDVKTFQWQFGELQKKFKKQRYSPLYNVMVGIQNEKFVTEERFIQKWNEAYEEKCPIKLKGQIKSEEKQLVKTFDFLLFHTLMAYVYGNENSSFEDLIQEKPDEYLKIYQKYFELSFLSAQKKLQKFTQAFSSEKNDADIYIIEQYCPEFQKSFNNSKKYFKATDSSKDVIILAAKKLFKQQKHKEIVLSKLNQEDKSLLQQLISQKIALLFLDNFIIVGVHFSSQQQKNKQQIQQFSILLRSLRRCFPEEEIICGGDFNSYYNEQFPNKEFYQFPADIEVVTTSKKRSMLQGQFKKSNQIINQSKDKIVSTLEIISKKIVYINGKESNKYSLLPTDQHPFDHFVLLASINLRVPQNLQKRKQRRSLPKKIQTVDLKIATLNYGGIMNSPFEFYTHKYIKELEEISRIFVQLLPYYFKNFKPEKFKWDTGKAEQKYKRGRYSPLYNPEVGVEKNRFVSKEQFKKEWEAAYEKCPEKVRAQTSENQKNQCFIYDLLAYHTLLAHVYGDNKTFEELVQQSPEPYLQKYRQFFSLSFLDEKKKLKKFQIALKRINADIFFIQEYSTAFEKIIDQNIYFITVDSQKDTLVLVKKSSFKNEIPFQAVSASISSEDIEHLNYLKRIRYASIFLDNFIIFSVHLSSKADINKTEAKQLKICLTNLIRIFPNHHIICGGDINSFLDYDEEFQSKLIYSYPSSDKQTTTVKKRTMIQAQFNKGNQLVNESKDKILSSLPFVDAKVVYVDDTEIDESSLAPTDEHPFDHFLVVATVALKQ